MPRIHRFGDSIDTDIIIAGKHMGSLDPDYLAEHCMAALAPGFNKTVETGDVLVAGRNFGCGSSRELAPIALKATGLACIVANSFSRIFFRSAVNIGLPVLICPEGVAVAEQGDEIEVNIDSGEILIRDQTFRADPLPDAVLTIVRAGGLVPLMREKLGAAAKAP